MFDAEQLARGVIDDYVYPVGWAYKRRRYTSDMTLKAPWESLGDVFVHTDVLLNLEEQERRHERMVFSHCEGSDA